VGLSTRTRAVSRPRREPARPDQGLPRGHPIRTNRSLELRGRAGNPACGLGKRAFFSLVIAPMFALFLAQPAAAYNGGGAANYADQYAVSPNSAYPNIWINAGDDCTDFVSQAMHSGGGYPFRGNLWTGNVYDDHNWFIFQPWPFYWWFSHSWSVAPELRNFLLLDWYGGWWRGETTGNSNTSTDFWRRWPTYMGLTRGDVLFYDWGRGQGWSHASMLVAQGGYSSGNHWYGDLVDAHSNNHWHAFWDLSEYNANYLWSTNVDAWHVDSRN
jgi:hypothetical protein